jgi:acetoin utilization protein AcuB
MLVKDIMSRNVVTVGLDDTLALVKEIFDHSKFHHLLALEAANCWAWCRTATCSRR